MYDEYCVYGWGDICTCCTCTYVWQFNVMFLSFVIMCGMPCICQFATQHYWMQCTYTWLNCIKFVFIYLYKIIMLLSIYSKQWWIVDINILNDGCYKSKP